MINRVWNDFILDFRVLPSQEVAAPMLEWINMPVEDSEQDQYVKNEVALGKAHHELHVAASMKAGATDSELQAINHYTSNQSGGHQNSSVINYHLTGHAHSENPNTKHRIATIDRFLASSPPSPSDVTLYSGIGHSWDLLSLQRKNNMPHTISSKAFLSFSFSMTVAEKFAEIRSDKIIGPYKNIACFTINKGDRVGRTISHLSDKPEELEFLVKRGHNFSIRQGYSIKKSLGQTYLIWHFVI